MADVITKTRTNYFKASDETGLRAFLAEIKTDGDPVTVVGKDGKMMFYCEAEIMGAMTEEAKGVVKCDPDWADDNPDLAWSWDLFIDRLKPYVADGDACIITTIGYEKIRSLWGTAYIVTSNAAGFVSLETMAKNRARNLLGSDWDTVMSG